MTMLLGANKRSVFSISSGNRFFELNDYCSNRNFGLFFRVLLIRRPPSIRATNKTKAIRIIFAGRLGSTAAVITVLTANNRKIFMVCPSRGISVSPIMYTATVGIKCLFVK